MRVAKWLSRGLLIFCGSVCPRATEVGLTSLHMVYLSETWQSGCLEDKFAS